MNFWKSAEGMVRANLIGADVSTTLRILNEKDIQIYRLHWEDELNVSFSFFRGDRKVVSRICEKRGDSVNFSEESGLFWYFRNLFHRHVLVWGMLFLFALTLFLPTRVLFFQVEGNETISDQRILETAETCGIRFGGTRHQIRSEKMKNALLSAMPELQWAGINTSGCTAVISVKERNTPEKQTISSGVTSIVASADGYITSCTATKGNMMCSPGQIVREGQILISGYTDCGLCIQVTEAKGEIYALTNHNFSGRMPSEFLVRGEKRDQRKRYSLIFGKKRINLWKGSGISPATCGRMYEEYYITLPGGFRLPIFLSVETLTDSETSAKELFLKDAEEQLSAFASSSVLRQTVAGTVLQQDVNVFAEKGLYKVQGWFFCSEMIGRVITEEIGETNGKDN